MPALPTYQQVYPASQVPLEVCDLPAADRSRELVADDLITEAERGSISGRRVPVLRATLHRFDDNDSVLVILAHHSVTDACIVWQMAIGAAGDLVGNVTFNVDEFDERKVTGWVSDYNRILSRLTSEPDRQWRQLADIAS